jgi:general secretion pathway protein E
MMELLLEPARRTGCDDINVLKQVIEDAGLLQRSPIDDVLDASIVNEEKYLCELSRDIDIEWLEQIPEFIAPLPLRAICGPRIALKHRLLPIEIVEEYGQKRLRLATFDPFNLIARQAAAQELKIPIDWCMASRRRIHESLRKLYGVGADTFEQILEGRDLDYENLESHDEANIVDDDDDAEASVVKFVNQIIREALEQRATDIHVEPLSNNLRIRYRIDGKLIEIGVPENVKALQSSVIARLKIMSRLDIAERRLPQDGRINLQFEGQTIDVRVATVPTVEGESVSLRLLNQEKFSIDKLDMEPFIRKKVESLLLISNGIVLITGPTGSGKSTTLYSFLTAINHPDRRIVTVEDPVENKLSGVMQIAVKSDIGLTFAAALRSILRADPNIVMIGEIRDLETAEIAIRASLTGHLVFSTLHTNDALGGLSRLTDMGVEPFLVAAAVRAFIAQRLVRKLCPHCKTPRHLSELERQELQIPFEIEGRLYSPVGCNHCRNTGFSGRLSIYELVLVTDAMQALVTQQASAAEMKAQAVRDGYIHMRTYGWYKAMQGLTTIEEIISVTSSDVDMEVPTRHDRY